MNHISTQSSRLDVNSDFPISTNGSPWKDLGMHVYRTSTRLCILRITGFISLSLSPPPSFFILAQNTMLLSMVVVYQKIHQTSDRSCAQAPRDP